jgi:hypothetical protein
MTTTTNQFGGLDVTLPAGGRLTLRDAEEVELWNGTRDRYVRDYALTQQNDLMLVGAILSQQLAMYRAQRRMNEPDAKISDLSASQTTITKAAEEIRELEKALGVDKKTREAGGQHTVANYITDLKAAAREYGIHLSRRLLAYEKFCMDLRWRLRLLANGDAEDRAYHDLTPEKVLKWAAEELAALEEVDRKYAREKGRIYAGRLK